MSGAERASDRQHVAFGERSGSRREEVEAEGGLLSLQSPLCSAGVPADVTVIIPTGIPGLAACRPLTFSARSCTSSRGAKWCEAARVGHAPQTPVGRADLTGLRLNN